MMKKYFSIILCIFTLAAALPYVSAQAAYTVDPATGVISDFDKSLSGKVIIPETDENGNKITAIAPYAFENCNLITEVVIPETVTKIGGAAFSGCTSLVSVTLPDKITAIPKYTFENCISLISVNLKNIDLIDDGAFWGCEALTEVTLSETLNAVGIGAFYKSGLVSVSLPKSLVSLGTAAFDSCMSLKSVNLGGTFTALGEWTFFGCKSLERISLPQSVTAIGPSAFEGCSALKSVYIPQSAENIDGGAFKGCTGFIITGKSGSAAETFAKEHGITFYDYDNHEHKGFNLKIGGTRGSDEPRTAEGECEICGIRLNVEVRLTDILLGDTDGNGVINQNDAILILRYDAAAAPIAPVSAIRADVDFSGAATSSDAINILRYDAKIITEF